MNIRDVVIPSVLTVTLCWAVSSFFFSPSPDVDGPVRAGQSFEAVSAPQMCQPIKKEIDFYDVEQHEEEHEVVQGYHSSWTFTNKGAALEELSFTRPNSVLTTLKPESGVIEREEKGFLLAFDVESPYDFEKVIQNEKACENHLVYQTETSRAFVTKKYLVSKNSHSVEVELSITPKDGAAIQPRLFMPAPWVGHLDSNKIQGVVLGDKKSLQQLDLAKKVNMIWASPEIFGLQNRYFIYSLVRDEDNFTQRAYYKIGRPRDTAAIFEGPTITEPTTWKMVFYCGPKEAESLNAVDTRLESVMNLGWFASLAKFVLLLLKYLYSYIGNYGWAIIILTMLIRFATWPFLQGSNKEMKRKEKERSKKIAYLKQRYKNQPERLAQEQMKVFKEYGFPGGKGLIGMLIQFPVFIALNSALRNSIELYQEPFLWINDLSAPDPYKLLAILFAGVLFLMISKSAKTPQQYLAIGIVSMVAAAITANVQAGLLLFMTVSLLIGYIQTTLAKA